MTATASDQAICLSRPETIHQRFTYQATYKAIPPSEHPARRMSTTGSEAHNQKSPSEVSPTHITLEKRAWHSTSLERVIAATSKARSAQGQAASPGHRQCPRHCRPTRRREQRCRTGFQATAPTEPSARRATRATARLDRAISTYPQFRDDHADAGVIAQRCHQAPPRVSGCRSRVS